MLDRVPDCRTEAQDRRWWRSFSISTRQQAGELTDDS